MLSHRGTVITVGIIDIVLCVVMSLFLYAPHEMKQDDLMADARISMQSISLKPNLQFGN